MVDEVLEVNFWKVNFFKRKFPKRKLEIYILGGSRLRNYGRKFEN